jgi:hypothetical protein
VDHVVVVLGVFRHHPLEVDHRYACFFANTPLRVVVQLEQQPVEPAQEHDDLRLDVRNE